MCTKINHENSKRPLFIVHFHVFRWRRQAGHRVGEHIEAIMPHMVRYCKVEDDELREYCLQAFESFVRRCPKEITSHIPTVC